jgi:hypothetical protein
VIQKIYWAATEGALAVALLVAGGSQALSAMQAASICAGFPYTIAICFMCTALYRACKIDFKEEDIMTGKKFNTALLDFCEGYVRVDQPEGALAAGERIQRLLISTFAPFAPLAKTLDHIWGAGNGGQMFAFAYALPFYMWIVLMIVDTSEENVAYIGWACYMLYVSALVTTRVELREKYNIYGSMIEDILCCLVMPFWVVSQMEMQCTLEIKMENQVPDFLRETVDESNRVVQSNGAEAPAVKVAEPALPATQPNPMMAAAVDPSTQL